MGIPNGPLLGQETSLSSLFNFHRRPVSFEKRSLSLFFLHKLGKYARRITVTIEVLIYFKDNRVEEEKYSRARKRKEVRHFRTGAIFTRALIASLLAHDCGIWERRELLPLQILNYAVVRLAWATRHANVYQGCNTGLPIPIKTIVHVTRPTRSRPT